MIQFLFFIFLCSTSLGNLIKDGNFSQTDPNTHFNPYWIQGYHSCDYNKAKPYNKAHGLHKGYVEFTTYRDNCPTYDIIYQVYNTSQPRLRLEYDICITLNRTTDAIFKIITNGIRISYNQSSHSNKWMHEIYDFDTDDNTKKHLFFYYQDNTGIKDGLTFKVDNVQINVIEPEISSQQTESETVSSSDEFKQNAFLIFFVVLFFGLCFMFLCYGLIKRPKIEYDQLHEEL